MVGTSRHSHARGAWNQRLPFPSLGFCFWELFELLGGSTETRPVRDAGRARGKPSKCEMASSGWRECPRMGSPSAAHYHRSVGLHAGHEAHEGQKLRVRGVITGDQSQKPGFGCPSEELLVPNSEPSDSYLQPGVSSLQPPATCGPGWLGIYNTKL